MKRSLLVFVALLAAGCLGAPPTVEPAPAPMEPDADLLAVLEELATFPELRFETDHGTIGMILYEAWTPETAAHIASLAESGFYDGTIVHRVVDDFVIQGGDPTGTGEGGSGPGGASTDPVPLEIKDGLQFGSGSVGLARWTDDTGDSQWFIAEKPALHLNDPQGATGDVFGAYSLFAQVHEGLPVVRSIAAVETLPNDRPVEDVVVQSVELLPPPSIDLIGLIPQVAPGINVQSIGQVDVEWPRHLVAEHPFLVRASNDLSSCSSVGSLTFSGATDIHVVLQAIDGDPCTWEGRTTLPAGSYNVHPSNPADQTSAFTTVDVLPWSDAYAPYV